MGFVGNGYQENRFRRTMLIFGNLKEFEYVLGENTTPFNSSFAVRRWQIKGTRPLKEVEIGILAVLV
jgi:hypothetical protein